MSKVVVETSPATKRAKRSAVTRARKPRTPESAVLRACLEYLALRWVYAWRNNSGAVALGGGSGPQRFVEIDE